MEKIILFLLLTTTIVFSQDIPRYIAYQGVLIDKNKQLKPDGDYSIKFELYDDEFTGTLIWNKTFNPIKIVNGVFGELLGPFDNTVKFDKQYFVQVTLGNEQLNKRVPLTSSAYALGIANNTVSNSKIQDNAVTGTKIIDNAITSSKIQDGEVIETKLSDKSVSYRTIQIDAIDSLKIKDKSISYNDLTTINAITGNVLTLNNNSWQPQTPSGVPVGTIVAYGGTTIPTGWVKCDGTEIASNSSTFNELYKAIGTNWGGRIVGGIQFFSLPDLRGRFPRGVDETAGNDPDKSSRVSSTIGGNIGNNVGSVQIDAFQGHWHRLGNLPTFPWDTGLSPVGELYSVGNGYKADSRDYKDGGVSNVEYSRADQITTDLFEVNNPNAVGPSGVPRTSSETRPKNVNVYYIIKY